MTQNDLDSEQIWLSQLCRRNISDRRNRPSAAAQPQEQQRLCSFFLNHRRFFKKLSAEVELKGVMEAKGEGILLEKLLKVVKTQEKTTILHQLG